LFNADELLRVSSGFCNAISGITEDVTVVALKERIAAGERDLKDAKSKGLTSQYTSVISIREEKCDSAYCTFRNFAKTSADQTDDIPVAEAGNVIVKILRNVNWDLHKLGYKKQLAQLSVLDEKMKVPEAVQALEVAGLKKWYDNLSVATANLDEVANKRVGEAEEYDHTPIKDAYDTLYTHLSMLYNHIGTQEGLFKGVYVAAASTIDATLNTITPEARIRKAKKPPKK
jgi:hypothetical protein